MITWTTPAYTEISMSAEIGGYQDDFDEHAPKLDDAIRTGDAAQSVPKEA
jgi:coenzyme PQQ precursor peptide PqqA